MVSIRKYKEGDRPTLVRFMEELQDYLVGIDPLKRLIRGPEYGKKYTSRLLEKLQKKGIVYIAEDEGRPIGCIAGLIEDVTPEENVSTRPGRKGVIEELYLEEAYRGKGVGSTLMKTIEDYFNKNGCDYARVDVFEPNPAHAFYEKHGYGDRLRKMHKELE